LIGGASGRETIAKLLEYGVHAVLPSMFAILGPLTQPTNYARSFNRTSLKDIVKEKDYCSQSIRLVDPAPNLCRTRAGTQAVPFRLSSLVPALRVSCARGQDPGSEVESTLRIAPVTAAPNQGMDDGLVTFAQSRA
jgi:hypothetical protein